MKNDLISRQKLIDDLEAWRKRLDRRVSRFDDMVIHALPAVFDLVNEQETIESEPVRHGRWFCECEPFHTCSECKHTFNLFNKTNYCPNCGAKMDGGAEDG